MRSPTSIKYLLFALSIPKRDDGPLWIPLSDALLLAIMDLKENRIGIEELGLVVDDLWGLQYFTSNLLLENTELFKALDLALSLKSPKKLETSSIDSGTTKQVVKGLNEYYEDSFERAQFLQELKAMNAR